ncbi:SAM-dependent methyltransferases YbcY [Salmonella enterica subsp. enterica serovar Rubislaw str. A4-653]|uniref:SAM-dependent methyltransferases YbcY n=1 Tax=Salmonella enterica subsp. enterica serovar Rubislaw str. A4-653 TaxID=913081 RepID=G5QIQ8_SALRU|nr:SAM-dependent methyltransferases YbcY [Salmonella enterica subsp. enterica serovar Rubislaw str. A4-653]
MLRCFNSSAKLFSERTMKHTQQSGAKVYNPFTLSLYDWWVLNISNKYAWKCPTDTRLLPFFLHHMGETHLDIGVGTGYYLKHAPATHAISLMDLNPDRNGIVVRARFKSG